LGRRVGGGGGGRSVQVRRSMLDEMVGEEIFHDSRGLCRCVEGDLAVVEWCWVEKYGAVEEDVEVSTRVRFNAHL
jgi:hypothetical protein